MYTTLLRTKAWLLIPLLTLLSLSARAQTVYLSETFESAFTGTLPAPTGWTQTNLNVGAVTGDRNWIQATVATTIDGGTGVPATVRSGGSGTKLLGIGDFNYCPSNTGIKRITTGSINLASSTAPVVRFFYYNYNTVRQNLAIVASANGGATWSIIGYTVSHGTTTTALQWETVNVKIPAAFQTSTARFGLQVTGTCGSGDIFIDDFSVQEPVTSSTNTYTGASGNWSVAANWSLTRIPSGDDDVVIPTGKTVTIDAAYTAVCRTLSLTGTLQSSVASSTSYNLWAQGDITINSGGVFHVGTSAAATGGVFCGGNLTNAGTLNLATTAISATGATVHFIGSSASTYTNTGTVSGGDNAALAVYAACYGGLSFASPLKVKSALGLINGSVNGTNLTIGSSAITASYPTTIFRYRGSFSTAPTFLPTIVAATNHSVAISYSEASTQAGYFMQGTPVNISTALEVPTETLSGVTCNVSGTLTVNTFGSVTLSAPLAIGDGTSTAPAPGLTLTRGQLITSATNLLTYNADLAGTSGSTPTLTTPASTTGSYIVGPVRILTTATASTTGARTIPLGEGTSFVTVPYSATNAPTSNAYRLLTITPGGTWGAFDGTVSITAAPGGSKVLGNRAYRIQRNSGDLLTTTTIGLVAMNTGSPIPGGGDNLTTFRDYLFVGQNATLNSGTWTQRGATALGTGLLSNNTAYSLTSGALGSATPLATNGEYFGWFDNSPACLQPLSATLTGTFNSLSLSWGTAASATSGYNWEIRTSGAAGSGATGLVTSGSTATGVTTASVVSGITPNTTYFMYVQSNCGANGLSAAWVASSSFKTPCASVGLPFTENFDGTPGTLPTCWGQQIVTSTGVFATSTSGFARSGTGRLFSSWSSNGAVFLPPVDLTAGVSYQYQFYARNADAVAGNFVKMKVNTAATLTGASMLAPTFTDVTTPNTVTNTFQAFTVVFTPATSGTYYFIAQDSVPTSAPNGFSFDDFSVQIFTCAQPGSPTLSSATTSSATIAWTAATPTPGSGYDWKIVASGAGSGAAGIASGNTASLTATGSGLTANTAYDVYVRGNCGANQSGWVGPLSITTLCNPVALPFFENFDATPGTLPSCWARQTITSTGVFATSSSGFARSGTGRVYSSWSSNGAVILPPMSLTAGVSYQFQFYARNADAVAGNFVKMKVNTAASLTGASLLAPTFTNTTTPNTVTNTFQAFTVVYTPASSGTYYFIAQDSVPTSSPNGFSFDDFSVDPIFCGGAVTLGTPSGITGSGATINFTGVAGASNGYEVQTSPDGTTWSASTTGPAGTGAQAITVSGLSGCSSYQYRVRGICTGGTQTSPWASGTFSTVGPVLPGYGQGFEAIATSAGSLPSCWSFETVSGAHYYSGTTTYKRTGSQGLYTYATTNGTSWIYGPSMTLTGGVTYRVRFYASVSSGTAIAVGFGSAAASASMTNITAISGLPSGFVNPTGKVDYYFTPASSGTYYVGLRNTFTSTFSYNIYDDYSLSVAPSCISPASVSAQSTNTTTALASWPASITVPGNGYFYKIVTGSGSYAAAAYSGQEGLTASLSRSFGALVDGSTYTVWIRSYCGPGTASTDSSEWVSTTFVHSAPLAGSVTQSSGTFTSIISNPSAQGLGWANSSTNTDDNLSDKTNIGFNFVYNGLTKTQFAISTNGRMRLFGAASAATMASAFSNGVTAADTNYLMPFWDDLVTGGATTGTLATLQGNMKYLVSGTAPNRTLTVEWTNMGRYIPPSFGFLSFQVVLEETTNKISYKYGQMQMFDFVQATNLLTTATIGFTGKTVTSPTNVGQVIVYQPGGAPGQNRWAYTGFRGTDLAANRVQLVPACGTIYTYDPNGTLATLVDADSTAPSYDDVLNPYTIAALGSEPTNLCNYTFSTKFASGSDLGSYPSLLPDNATNGYADDDVWITFQAQSPNTTIKMVGSGGMRPAFQLYDASLAPVSGGIKVGTATDYGRPISLSLGNLITGDFYYIRAYHYHGGTQATGTATVAGGVVTGVTLGAAGSDYNYGSGTGIAGPEVNVYGGGGTGAIVQATISAGAVTGYTVSEGGSGYTSAPTVRVSRPGYSVSGSFGLYVFSTPAPPANDLVRNAAALTITSGSSCSTPLNNQLTYAATGTTRTSCTGTADDDVWYKFTAASPAISIVATPNTAPNSMDVAVQLFNAGAADDTTTMTSVSCVNVNGNGGVETVSANVTPGNVYYVRVYAPATGDGGITGKFSICGYAPAPLAYTFAQSVGTYSPISPSTVVFSSGNMDDDTLGVDLSPAFTFNGISYNRVIVATNGYLAFGRTGLTTSTYAPLSSTASSGIIAAYAGDMDEAAAGSPEIGYALVGNEHIFQWTDVAHYFSDQQLSFQIRLNHATGGIQFVYDSVDAGTSTYNHGVGVRGILNSYPYFVHNRTNTDQWQNTTTGTTSSSTMTLGSGPGLFPGSGMTYNWTPATIAGYPIFTGLVGATSYPTANTSRVRWMPKVEATGGYKIRWRKRAEPISAATYASLTQVGSAVSDTSYTLTGLKANTAYIFDVAAFNGSSVSAFSPAGSFTTLPLPNDATYGTISPNTSLCTGTSLSFNVPFKSIGTSPISAGESVRVGVIITGPVSGNVFKDTTLPAALTSPASISFVTPSFSFSSAGTYQVKQYVVWANDQDNSNDTAATSITITVANPLSVLGGYKEGLNSGIPSGYSTEYSNATYPLAPASAVSFSGGGGAPSSTLPAQEGSGVLTFNSFSATAGTTSALITPCFDITNACSVFKFSLGQNTAYPSVLDGVEVYVSANGGGYQAVQLRDSINRVLVTRATRYDAGATTSRWNQYQLDLSPYSGQTIKIKMVAISGFGDNFGIDNLRIDQSPANDVGVFAIQSPEPSPTCASSTTPLTISIRNYGCDPQTDVPVTINITTPAGPQPALNLTFAGTIPPATTVTQTITTIDLTTIGTYFITASTNLVGDGATSNDATLAYKVTVNSSNLPPVITATLSQTGILVGSSTSFSATAPASATVAFPNNTNRVLTTAYTGSSVTIPGSIVGTLPASVSSIAYVEVNAISQFDGDLYLRLKAPDGSTVQLVSGTLSGSNLSGTRFVPTGGSSIGSASAPYSGNYNPSGSFSSFTGAIAGTWTLEAYDISSTLSPTTFLNWSIAINNTSLTNVWTASVSNPASVAGFPFSGLNPGSKTFTAAGTYQFTFTSSYANGCSNSLTRTLLVSDGNVWTGLANDQQWNTSGNWQFTPAPPSPGSAVTIPGGLGTNYPTITSGVSTANLTMGASAKINIASGGSLAIAGNVTGALSNITGVRAVTFTGPGTQTISGTVTLDSVTVTNTNTTGLTFASGGQLRITPGGNLRLGNNARITVPANGALVLQSSATATARLLSVPASAQINGNITMQRRTPTTQGWYFVGAPVRTGDLNQWAEMGARVSPKNNANIFEYTEPDTTRGRYNGYLTEVNGWKVPSALTNPINPTTPSLRPKGYRMYLNNAFMSQQAATLSVTGLPIIGGITFPFTKTAAGFQGGGWNLASNPYPCEIDWQAVKTDAVAGNASAPLSDFIQIWNTASGAYSNYSIAVGIGTNGGSRYIPSSQAFFVRATGNGNLNFRETHKVQQSNTFLRDVFPANTLRLTLSDGSHTDQSVVAFRVFALNGRDQYDADKLNGNYLNVSTMPEPTLNLVANVMGELVSQTEIPVRVGSTTTGTQNMTLSFEGMESFDAGSTLYLRDNYLNTLTDLNQTQVYSFQITQDPASYGDARFVLVTAPQSVTVVKTKVQPSISVWPNPAEGASQLNVRLANLGNGNAVVTLTDALGRVVVRSSAALSEGTLETTLKIDALPAGVYMLRARSGSATIVKEVVIR